MVIVKRPKIEGSGSQGRVCTSDFDDLTKSLIEATISIYKAQIGAIHPFLERADNCDVVKQGWLEVCNDRGVWVELGDDVFKLVTDHASQAHGFLKTISKPYVLQAYNIDGQVSKHDVHDKIEHLLDGATFIYKDPEANTGIFCNHILQTLVNKMWFKHKGDEGVIHPEFSDDNMLPLATIALVLTVIENLDKWVTGEHIDVPFTAATYKDKYRGHLRRLTNFPSKTLEAEIIPRLQKHMLKVVCKHARVEDSAITSQAANISNKDIEAAKKEWEDLVLSEEE